MSEESKLERPASAEQAVQKEVKEKITRKPSRKLFGTFSGVFTPTLLTILGVIMYLRLLGLTGDRNYHEMTENLPDLAKEFEKDQIFSTWTVVDAATFPDNLAAGLEALGGAFFRSSMIVLPFPRTVCEKKKSIELFKMPGKTSWAPCLFPVKSLLNQQVRLFI